MAGLRRNTTEAMISNRKARNPKSTGKDAAVIAIKMAVDKARSPILTILGPIFRKTAVVIARARKIKALAVSVSCIRSV
jgi:hypothetical protein